MSSLTKGQRAFLEARAEQTQGDVAAALTAVLEDLVAHQHVVHVRHARLRSCGHTALRARHRPRAAVALGALLDDAMLLARLRACLDTPATLARERKHLHAAGYERPQIERLLADRWARCGAATPMRTARGQVRARLRTTS